MRQAFLLILIAATSSAQNPPAWVAKSNLNAQLLIDLNSRYSPENATSTGVKTLDGQITVFTQADRTRLQADLRKAKRELESRLAVEKDPLVRQDLQILIASADRDIRSNDANFKTFLPYYDVAGLVYFGVKSLLDDQIAPERRPSVLIRLKKYAGMEPGFVPAVTLAERRFRDGLKTPGLLGPARSRVEKDLGNSAAYIDGIGLLLEKYKIQGYAPVFAKLKEQLN